MDISEIKGKGQIVFGGKTHALDVKTNTFCGQECSEFLLCNDEWGDCFSIDEITCKKCIKKLKRG